MRSLSEFILEQLLLEKFDNPVSTYDNLLQAAPHLKVNGLSDENKEMIKSFFMEVLNQEDVENPFVYSKVDNYFKIVYDYLDAILSVSKNYPEIEIRVTDNGKKCKGWIKGVKGMLFETGSGSVNKISTVAQESATCLVWNEFVRISNNNEQFDDSDESITTIVNDIGESFDKTWIKSFREQLIAITAFLERKGLDYKEYRMCRYGAEEPREIEGQVGKAYGEFIQKYTSLLRETRKDAFDPSDVLLYRVDKASEITSMLKTYANTPVESKSTYIEELFKTDMVIGVSLKKISKSGVFHEFNVNGDAQVKKVNRIEIIPAKRKANNLTIDVYGDFNFSGLTDAEGDAIKHESVVRMTLRTFGDPIAIDCSLRDAGAPAIGKCPVSIWRKMIDVSKSDNLEKCIEKMKSFIEETPKSELYEKIGEIIKGAAKEGPNCFPFILIH